MTALSVDLHFHPEARRHFLQLGCYLADFQRQYLSAVLRVYACP